MRDIELSKQKSILQLFDTFAITERIIWLIL